MLYTLFFVLKGHAKHHFPVYLYLLKSMIAHNGAQQSHDFLKLKSLNASATMAVDLFVT